MGLRCGAYTALHMPEHSLRAVWYPGQLPHRVNTGCLQSQTRLPLSSRHQAIQRLPLVLPGDGHDGPGVPQAWLGA